MCNVQYLQIFDTLLLSLSLFLCEIYNVAVQRLDDYDMFTFFHPSFPLYFCVHAAKPQYAYTTKVCECYFADTQTIKHDVIHVHVSISLMCSVCVSVCGIDINSPQIQLRAIWNILDAYVYVCFIECDVHLIVIPCVASSCAHSILLLSHCANESENKSEKNRCTLANRYSIHFK